ncbi:MAG: T9SS type A sorting domain-containing protein [Melioribacteraceae bacterium]|nr:MAG: T9SS type A sorting domain-containing protein [Melioribacteraceae bacterium]
MKSLITIIFLLSLLSSILLAQNTRTNGNLLRINIFENEIDLSDTVGSWSSWRSNYSAGSRYQKVFTYNGNLYFILYHKSDNPQYTRTDLTLQSSSLQYDYNFYGYFGWLDVLEPYLFFDTQIQPTSSGIWILNGILDVSFVNNNNELFEESSATGNIVHIPGKIKNNYLIATYSESEYEYDYSIAELSDSLHKRVIQNINVQFENEDSPSAISRLRTINDSLYFTSAHGEYDTREIRFSISKLKDSTLTIIDKSFENDHLTYWTAFENRIIGVRNRHLIAQTLNLDTFGFENIDTLALNVDSYSHGSKYDFSPDERFGAFIRNDSLFAVSLENESIINSWDLQNIDNRYAPLIDSPYVYVHQATTIVGVEEENDLPKEITLSQNYPNPFNPSTTIKFTVPNVGTTHELSLRVYDILGREIKTLLNKPMQPGTYEIEFDGGNFTSGVYFYVLETGGKRLSRKMVLLK